jgi:hypothetical protein
MLKSTAMAALAAAVIVGASFVPTVAAPLSFDKMTRSVKALDLKESVTRTHTVVCSHAGAHSSAKARKAKAGGKPASCSR